MSLRILTMGWLTPIILRIVLINTVFAWFLKAKVVSEDANFVRRFFLMYALSAADP